ncbi:MAG: hypothetical protein ACTXOO_05530 [Sodalis sp. (in: enterobacteria)]
MTIYYFLHALLNTMFLYVTRENMFAALGDKYRIVLLRMAVT